MKRVLSALLVLVCLAGLVGAGAFLWDRRPWRVAVTVNGRPLVWSELDLRAKTLLDDARRVEHLTMDKSREGEALQYYRKQAARMWIVKEVMLDEALARGCEVSPADEKAALAQVASRLKSRNLTPETFFKEGPLPEDLKRRDFREGVLINKFTDQEIRSKIKLSAKEIDDRQTDLKRLALLRTKPGEAPRIKSDRKAALETLRAERFQSGFEALFRTLFRKAEVKCPEFPELEKLEGLTPRHADAKPAENKSATEAK